MLGNSSARGVAATLFVLGAAACGDLFHDTDWRAGPAPSSAGVGGQAGSGGSSPGPGGSGSASVSAGSGGSSAAPDCHDYCKRIGVACNTATTAMYASETTCLATCAAFPPGNIGDISGNTLGCRLFYAEQASMDPQQCVFAGPGGANRCGANCDGFCSIALDACATDFADLDACMSACKAFSDTVPYNASTLSGDSLACRLYHATAAADDPATHCAHILPVSRVCAPTIGN